MLTEQVAQSLNTPDLRILEVAHPLGGTDEATIESWAEAAVDEALELFTDSPDPGRLDVASSRSGSDLDGAVADVRALVGADGGEVELEGFDDTTVRLRLVLDTAECRECVMPREFLEQVALDTMRAHLPDLRRVTIEDPREA